MSYEGYEQFICENGHAWITDHTVFSSGDKEKIKKAIVCKHCDGLAFQMCSVDETNGYDQRYPETFPGPMTLIGLLFPTPKSEKSRGDKIATYKVDNSTKRWRKTKPFFDDLFPKENSSVDNTSEGFIKKAIFPDPNILGKIYPCGGVSVKIIGGILDGGYEAYVAEILNNDPFTKGRLFIGHVIDNKHFKMR